MLAPSWPKYICWLIELAERAERSIHVTSGGKGYTENKLRALAKGCPCCPSEYDGRGSNSGRFFKALCAPPLYSSLSPHSARPADRQLTVPPASLGAPPAALLPAMLPALLPAPPAPPALPPVLAPLAQLALPTLLTPTLLNVPRRRAYVRPMRRRASSRRHSTDRWTRERRFLLYGRGCGRCLGSAGSTEGSGGDRGRASTSRSSSGPCCTGTPRSRSCIRRTATPPSTEAASSTPVKNRKPKPATR